MSTSNTVSFEQPVSERVRAMLRLEHLFNRASALHGGTDEWTSRASVQTVLEVMAVMTRGDLRKQLLKELSRQVGALQALADNPRVDASVLTETRAKLTDATDALRAGEFLPGMELKEDQLLNVVRARAGIPAGDCCFDAPAYHRWLSQPAEQRQADLTRWFSAFGPLKEAVTLCLALLRQSSGSTDEVATAGFYQHSVDSSSAPLQIVRVLLPFEAGCYPEVSAGRHRFTIRFMHAPDADRGATQVNEDVPFKLVCCSF